MITKNRKYLEFDTPFGLARQTMPGETTYWYTCINALDPNVQEMDNDANLRAIDESHAKKLSDTFLTHSEYAEAATPITCFSEREILFQSPTGQWVDSKTVDANFAAKVRRIRVVFNRLDGGHRARSFAIAAQTIKEELGTTDAKYVRLAICEGVPESDIQRRTDICVGHNAGKTPSESARLNKLEVYEPVKLALGELAESVEWYGNARSQPGSPVVYKPSDIFAMMTALAQSKGHLADLNVGEDWSKIAPMLKPLLPVVQKIVRAYEIIVCESDDAYHKMHGSEHLVTAAATFDGRKLGRKKKKKTASLGVVSTYPLNKPLALLALHSYGDFFLKDAEGWRLSVKDEEFYHFIRLSLPAVMKKICSRSKELTGPRDYLRKTEKKNVKGKEITVHTASLQCSKLVSQLWEGLTALATPDNSSQGGNRTHVAAQAPSMVQ